MTLATGLAAPWSVVPLPAGGALISGRGDGTVLELTAAGEVRTAGVVPGVVSGGESGLHGLAVLEADGERWLYAYHGASDDNRVVRMPLTGDEGALQLGAAQVVLDGIARARNHDGGRIAFGPDGFLYIATGDAGRGDTAQDPASLNGKILRVTSEGDPAPGNPFGTAVFSMGHRNVQGLTWTTDGTLWATEFGQNAWDEVNAIRAGQNYGWPLVEGIAQDERFVDPAIAWTPEESSPSGMAALGDTLFVAGLRGERLWMLDTAGEEVVSATPLLIGEYGRLRDAVAAPDGGLWVLTNNTDGRGSPGAEDDRLLQLPVAAKQTGS
ncbi:PQQ-dependent sugar dehydrogenase [Microbacterium sp. Root61]|uniref:PQQ-dependent sugar dehydrogenase n=1 Tax=Microbacterium sp. Root61 TaxID=1736570 RepID=UPI000A9DD250|nr:PQQ-dependent sugar dehydrogenase [Microbacterium sp. Root61]